MNGHIAEPLNVRGLVSTIELEIYMRPMASCIYIPNRSTGSRLASTRLWQIPVSCHADIRERYHSEFAYLSKVNYSIQE